MTSLQNVQEAVEGLYRFRDQYFKHHPVDAADKKIEEVNEKMKVTLQIVDNYQDTCEKIDKAQLCMLKGKVLNVTPEFNQQALEMLSKSVKLNPKLVDAWNELGECYWKKGDIQAAKNCFEGALKHSKNKISIRNLSMVLRQIGDSHQERMSNIQESVNQAKVAVEIEPEDGKSWYILGNAYLSLFFVANQNPNILKQCLSAYNKALQDEVTKSNPDVHFNRATALKYEENYQGALESLEKAAAFDPLWEEPREKLQHLLEYLKRVQDMVTQKGCQKPRRLRTLLKALKPQHLGPFSGDSYTNSRNQSVRLQHVKLSDLKPGINTETVVLGKVVCNIPSQDPVAFTFCIIDEEEVCFSVTVYNLAEGKGVIIGDSVAIAEPFVEPVHVKFQDKEFNFNNIRVDVPMVMVVNGRKIKADFQAAPRLSVTVKSE